MSVEAFVTEYPNLSKFLNNNVIIRNDSIESSETALWDTGATGTCISKDVVANLNLVPHGKELMHTPSGYTIVNKYIVDVILPSNYIARDVVVCDSEIGTQSIGVLVGMDIITLGDFSVSNYNGKTVFTFRTPSQERIDYVNNKYKTIEQY